jgi:hypothetical protein
MKKGYTNISSIFVHNIGYRKKIRYECFCIATKNIFYLLYIRGYYNNNKEIGIMHEGDAKIDYAATYTGHIKLSELFLLHSEHYQ